MENVAAVNQSSRCADPARLSRVDSRKSEAAKILTPVESAVDTSLSLSVGCSILSKLLVCSQTDQLCRILSQLSFSSAC